MYENFSINKLSNIFKDVNRFEVEDKVCVLIDNLKDNYENDVAT